jgi:AcrR family transcriptional regulator
VNEPSPAKPSYHHGDLRSALIRATVKLIEERGPNGITLRAVAAKAGVTKTAPYRHFSNKQAMIDAVAEEGFSELQAQLAAAADRSEDPLTRIRRQAIAYARFAVQRPGHYQVMFLSEAPTKTVTGLAAPAFQSLVDRMVGTIEAAQRAGAIKNEPALEIALSLWSLIHGLSTAVASRRLEEVNASDLEAIVSKVMDHLLHGIGRSEND